MSYNEWRLFDESSTPVQYFLNNLFFFCLFFSAIFPWFCSVSLYAHGTEITKKPLPQEQRQYSSVFIAGNAQCLWSTGNIKALTILVILYRHYKSVRNIGRWKVWMSSWLADMSESKQTIAPCDFVLSIILHKVLDNASFWTTSPNCMCPSWTRKSKNAICLNIMQDG